MQSVSNDVSSSSDSPQRASCRRHADTPFPSKLYEMLEYVEQMGLCDVISWLPHGRAFKIHNKDMFMSHVAKRFFKATKLRSIHRQMNLWGYKRIPNGDDRDAWYHENFLRGRPGDIKKMVRTKIKCKSLLRAKPDLGVPNFYQMLPIQSDIASDLLDKFEHMFTDEVEKYHYVSHPTIKPTRAPLPILPSLETLTNTPQAPQAPLVRRDRYRHAISSQTPASQMIELEPLPIGDSNDIVYCHCDDEFSLFIDQMINDPSA
mmetsp:Transcript_28957/g.53464  ORF Transcript_28957/g.53464 Transcript_28957/m.53464 type:complete len:261 (+) Transcript_28957:96-878(+)|eukprot:CAMPEP_0202010596 /NCGR_PEP_ID=MMETSP0905-20130828/17658_1 /ASSEMBLY_ACC=CAM_ASM_000554 /TAXON_ID=420261 /ORGANISM="Thalassiosira antarctica, Strain CCMP982" /LENGTH=260 /DNA_ID=CAMNT_0048569231 /DNA_START=80 /DNA_END=862 /DNA_ORIENTATION=-